MESLEDQSVLAYGVCVPYVQTILLKHLSLYKRFVLFMKGKCKVSMVFSVSMSIALPKAGDVVGKMEGISHMLIRGSKHNRYKPVSVSPNKCWHNHEKDHKKCVCSNEYVIQLVVSA